MKKKGRIISLVLVLSLVFNSLPLTIFADDIDLNTHMTDGAIDINIDEDLLNIDKDIDVDTDIKDGIDDMTDDNKVTSDDKVDIKTISRYSYMDLNNDDVKDLSVIKKGLDYTVFDDGNGNKVLKSYLEAVRYKDEDGKIKDYDNSIKSISESDSANSTDGYQFTNTRGSVDVLLPKSLEEGIPIKVVDKEKEFSMKPLFDDEISSNTTSLVKQNEEDLYGDVEKETTAVVFSTDQPSIKYEYQPINDGVKEYIVLNKEPKDNVFFLK